MAIAGSTRALVGDTPLVALSRVGVPGREVLGKCEFLNPGGSVKDRIGYFMIERALADGRLLPGGTVIEPTAGNTGVGLATACAELGLAMVAVMPERFSLEKALCVEALGGEVVRTAGDAGMVGAIERANEIALERGGWVAQQFSNLDNRQAHYETTGPEVWRDCEGRLDAFVAGVGSAGTCMGAGAYLKERDPNILLVAVEPQGSTLGGGEAGPHKVEGIGVDDAAQVAAWDAAEVDRIDMVDDREAHRMTLRLAREEGLLLGASSGAMVEGACRVAADLPEGARVVTLLADGGDRYLTKGLFGPFEGWER